MARASHPFDALIDHAAGILADRIQSRLGGRAKSTAPASTANTRAPGGASANERRRAAMTGRKLDMSCRIVGCKNRSGGPGSGYMCQEHRSLPKKQQEAAREAWKLKHAE